MNEQVALPLTVLLLLGIAVCTMCRGEVSQNLLKNPSFAEGADAKGTPTGWGLYGGGGKDQGIKIIEMEAGRKALLLEDGDLNREIGIVQTVPARGGETYEAGVKVRGVEGQETSGAYLQMRFLPSNHYEQRSLDAQGAKEFREISLKATAPPDTKSLTIYLYTHRGPTPKVLIAEARLVSGVEPPPPPPPPPPEPIPPQYTKLKDLRLATALLKDGKPNVAIVAPPAHQGQAVRIRQAIEKLTGAKAPIVGDDSPEAAVPIKGNLIALGNRSTSKFICKLYDLFYTLTDLQYPGAEGYEVRTLHDPFGNGSNVVLVGASDDAGMDAATTTLVRKIEESAPALTLGRLMEIKLGKGITVPKNLKDFEIWEASASYRSSGYFGWCSISKRMAMYYMTGDPFQAREVVRLSFPDKQAFKEITEIDEERIENKDDPLAGFYHYNAHMAILFWDLIEESPVFTDDERLRITNAFARQLNHRRDEGIYRLTRPPSAVGSRHGQYSALSLYCLGRYFNKYYPDPIWEQSQRSSEFAFGSLHEHAWVSGENDNLFWYNTATAPILTYMVLTGDRKPLQNGVLGELLRGQEILASGRQPDSALNSAALDFLHKAAYLTQDGRWILYRERTGVDTGVFRLGQSFWPEAHLKPTPPADIVNTWSIHRLPRPMWEGRASGLPYHDSFLFGSFRSSTDASGDFILLDGFNGASRNPYHCFAILQLRLDGYTLLDGYNNQVLTKADGMVEPQVAMDAALRHADVVGPTAFAVADVPRMSYCNWRRLLAQRAGRYALIIDDLASRTDTDNLEVQIKWEGARGFRSIKGEGVLRAEGSETPAILPGWVGVRAVEAQCASNLTEPRSLVTLDSIGIMLLRATDTGAWIEMPFELKEAVAGEVFANFIAYDDRGTVRILLDGKTVCEQYDLFSTGAAPARVSLGKHNLPPGNHRLRVEVIGKRPEIEKCYVGLAGLSVRPEGAPAAVAPQVIEIRSADVLKTTPTGRTAVMEWTGPVKENQRRIFFSLIAKGPSGEKDGLACVRVAENAAALALPVKGLAVAGEYAGVKGEFAIVTEEHVFGKALTDIALDGALLRADSPVSVDWDFAAGALHIVAEKDTRVSLALDGADDLQARTLPAGRHVLTNMKANAVILKKTADRLAVLLAEGSKQRSQAAPETARDAALPPLQAAMTATVGGNVTAMITIPSAQGPLVCAAEGSRVHVLATDGKEVRLLQADDNIRVLHWWPEPKLLLAGCVDEKVIAFDETGQRKWVFTSEMDPAVFRAAKQYWFKSAPGHGGIHGLYSGVFLDGKSQAFVGSACTLEIIDETGGLVKRVPVFWGCGVKFALVDCADGSRNLLIARQPTDSHGLAVINNRKPDAVLRSFDGVPSGHTYVGGWACMSRKHIFYDDLDGDGKKEIASEINGTWNRITVWSDTGAPLYNAQFGPGSPIPTQNIRDLDMTDLDGDGKKELVTATSGGLVVALNARCEKVWAKRLPSPATVLKCVKNETFVGCEDGTVAVLNNQGELIRSDKIAGRPTNIETTTNATNEPLLVLVTDKGEVKAFKPSN